MQAHQLINSDSGSTEYFTPQPIIEAARQCMGAIDLDPASSQLANERVKAGSFFTKEQDGLKMRWFGCVWMNHPFSREGNPLWINKLIKSYADGDIVQACCITYAATSEAWFTILMRYPQCFLIPRTNYHLPDGTLKCGVSKGSVVTYLGKYPERFTMAFSGLGVIKVHYKPTEAVK